MPRHASAWATSFLLVVSILGAHAGLEADAVGPQQALGWSLEDAPRAAPVAAIGGNEATLVLVMGDGVPLRSFDGGNTWDAVTGLPPINNPRIAFHPLEPSIGYLAGTGGVWRTTDHAETWIQVLEIERAARIDISETGLVAVGARLGDESRTVLLSADEGETWNDLDAPIPDIEPVCGVAFGSTDQVIMTMTDTQSWYTHDGGATWTETPGAALDFIIETGGPIWRLDMGVLEKTSDDGVTWQPVTHPGLATTGGPHRANGIWLATNEGLLLTRDSGTTWKNLGHGDQVFDATSIQSDPHDDEAAFLTDARVGLARIQQDQAGTPWYDGRVLPNASPVAVTDLATTSDGAVATAGPNGLHLRADNGPWRHTGAGLGGVSPLTATALSNDARFVYTAGTGLTGAPAVQVSDDHGTTFHTSTVTNAPGTVTRITVDPEDGTRALLVAKKANGEHSLWETEDAGKTWTAALATDLPVAITGIDHHTPSGAILLATQLGLFARIHGEWLPMPTEGITALATHGPAIIATGDLLHWQDAGIDTLPLLLPVEREAPTSADAIAIKDTTVWLLSDALWGCTLHADDCIPFDLPGSEIRGLGVSHDKVLLASPDGLWSS